MTLRPSLTGSGTYVGNLLDGTLYNYLVIGSTNNAVGIMANSPEDAMRRRLAVIAGGSTDSEVDLEELAQRKDVLGSLYCVVGPFNTVHFFRIDVEVPPPVPPARLVIEKVAP